MERTGQSCSSEEDRLPNVSDRIKEGLVREPAKRSRVTLKEPEKSTAQMGETVHWTTFHKTGLYGSVESKQNPFLKFATRHVADLKEKKKNLENVLRCDKTKIDDAIITLVTPVVKHGGGYIMLGYSLPLGC